MSTALPILAGIVVVVGGVIGVLLTAMTLPGTWLAILIALGVQWWHGWYAGENMFSWWSIGACVALAAAAEIVEFFASAIGAQRAGGTRRGAIGSVIGGLIGAIAGTFLLAFLPIIGTIIGATVGAGVGAIVAERSAPDVSWKQAGKVGAGAAVGRLAATVAKTAFAGAIAAILAIDAFV